MRVYLESPTGKGTVRMVERKDTEDVLVTAIRLDGAKKEWATPHRLAEVVEAFENGGFIVVERFE